ncbi:hypothetical protein BVW01_05585 [Mycobacterium tuberculosis]|nr:hypothetical protein BVW01_05585 [Mycobacterium tuberculosis]
MPPRSPANHPRDRAGRRGTPPPARSRADPTIDYADVEKPKVKLPPRPLVSGNYRRPPRELSTYVDDYVATLIAR